MTDISGRTAFITGGANGIGLGIARSLAKDGVKLALADRDTAGLERAKAELSRLTEVDTVTLDVRDREGFARAADAVEASLGPVSLLFNNAGAGGGGPGAKLTYELWDWSMGVNIGGVINGLQTFLPRMIERNAGGHIVNTSSGAGLVASSSGVLYSTSKFAINGLTECLRPELEEYGIGVSVLSPGLTATEVHKSSADGRPENPRLSAEEAKKMTDRDKLMRTFMMEKGRSPDEVGEMTVQGVKDNRLFIITDRLIVPFLEARHKEILASLPPEEDCEPLTPDLLAASDIKSLSR